MIDRWTLVHFAFWFVAGANFEWHRVPITWAVGIVLVGALLWEVAESWLERKGLVSGSEVWQNRWISDPLISFVGAGAGYWWVG